MAKLTIQVIEKEHYKKGKETITRMRRFRSTFEAFPMTVPPRHEHTCILLSRIDFL